FFSSHLPPAILIYTLSLHDALPISAFGSEARVLSVVLAGLAGLSIVVGSILALSQTDMKRLLAYSSIAHAGYALLGLIAGTPEGDRKSTRLNSSHGSISYAVFCLKK